MKCLTPFALLAAAFCSAVVTLPFMPLAKTHPGLFACEVRMHASQSGEVRIYYDDGTGLSENHSAGVPFERSEAARTYRIELPPGTYRSLRLDPSNRDGTVTIESVQIVSARGNIVRAIALADWQPANQIARLSPTPAGLEVEMTPAASDPQLQADFPEPLVLRFNFADATRHWLLASSVVFAALLLVLLALERAPRAAAGRLRQWALARPRLAIGGVAIAAVVASAYPIVFLGKSYVSPNYGTTLLYNTVPTLPAFRDTRVAANLGSDVGAMAWQNVPYGVVERRALLHGELPLWNRYNSAGVPLLGQGQSMWGDPLHFLVVLAGGNAWAWDLKFLAAKWLFAAGLGLLVLALARHLPAALIVAAAAPFIGFFNFRFNHPALFSLCYAPWPLYCWVGLTFAPTRRSATSWIAGLMAANFALMNSGTVKEAYLLLLTMNFSGACLLLAARAPRRERLLKFAGAAWAGVLLVLMAAPIWATFFHTLANAYNSYELPGAAQIQPSLLLGAFDELFYRPLMRGEWIFCPSVNFVIALGLLYFLATLRHAFRDRAAMALAFSSLVPLAFAFGLVPAAWIVHVPFLANVAHIDNCFSCALMVLWPVLAGFGFARAATRLRHPVARTDLAVAGLLLFAVVFAWLGFRQSAHRAVFGPDMTFTVLRAGETIPVSAFVWWNLAAVLVASLIATWIVRRALLTRRLTPAGALLLVLAVAAMLWRGAVHAPSVGFEEHLFHATGRPDFFARSAAVEGLQQAQAREPSRVFGLPGVLTGGWTAVYGLETIWGPDALMNRPFRDLVTSSGVAEGWFVNVPAGELAKVRPLFDAFNVRYYADRAGDPATLGRVLAPVAQADLDVYESRSAWPRAFFTDRLGTCENATDFLALVRQGDGRPFAAMHPAERAASAPLAALPADLDGRLVTPATHYQLSNNATSFEIHADKPGIAVLLETYWPGDFRVAVDGRKAAVLRVNHAFKGVVIDTPGDHQVTFRYVPKSFYRHLELSAAGFALLGLTLFVGWRPRRVH